MSQHKQQSNRPKPSSIRMSRDPSSNGTQKAVANLPAQPAPDDTEGWKEYWAERQLPWRREPEIDAARQQELAKCYAVVPDIEQGRYRFGGMKLNRADVEWLLATYQNQFTPEAGLDIRGAILDGADLSALPLRGLCGGLTMYEHRTVAPEQAILAAAHMKDVSLMKAHLEGACLNGAHVEDAHLNSVYLENAILNETYLQGADLDGAHLQNALLLGAHLQTASIGLAELQGAHLDDAHLQGVCLKGAHLQGAFLIRTELQGAHLNGAHLEGASFYKAQFEGADLSEARFEGAHLQEVWFTNANLKGIYLENADLSGAIFADLQGIGPRLVDARWGGVNLAVVEWSRLTNLGNESIARQKKDPHGNKKAQLQRLHEYQEAVRANRQLAVALQDQGLNEDAGRFAYRANMLQSKVLWFQMLQAKVSLWQRMQKVGAWLFSHLLNVLAGYGYKPGRSFLAYLLVVFSFMGLYLLTSHFVAPHLTWDEALVLSLSSFHGRGFFTQTLTLGDPYARLAVAEAVLGLFVEVSLIATFTQRFFGK